MEHRIGCIDATVLVLVVLGERLISMRREPSTLEASCRSEQFRAVVYPSVAVPVQGQPERVLRDRHDTRNSRPMASKSKRAPSSGRLNLRALLPSSSTIGLPSGGVLQQLQFSSRICSTVHGGGPMQPEQLTTTQEQLCCR